MWIDWKRFSCGALLLASLALLFAGCGDLGGKSEQSTATKSISGIVSSPQTGLPLADAQVTAYAISAQGVRSDAALSIDPATATTDYKGRYQLHIPASYSGAVMIEAEISGGTVQQFARRLVGAPRQFIRSALPQQVVARDTVPPVMVSFATNTVVEFMKQNDASTGYSSDNIRKATAALETFFGPNFAQTPPPASASDSNTSKAQQDLIVSIAAINSVLSSDPNTTIATIVSALVSNSGLGPIADSIKSGIAAAATDLAAAGTLPPEYVPSAAINTAISNAQSAPVLLPTLGDTTPPTAPTALSATAVAPRNVRLSWNASGDDTGVAGYLVCRADASGVFASIDSVPASAASAGGFVYSDLSAEPQSRYSYRVVAFDAARNLSEASAPASVTTAAPADAVAPGQPAGLACKGYTDSQVVLQWQQSTKTLGDGSVVPAASYHVYRDSQLIQTVTETFFSDKTVAAGTSYSYFVKAADADGNLSAASQSLVVRSATAAGVTVPAAPSALALAAPASYSRVPLVWSASSTAGVTYSVYRDGVLIASGIQAASYDDTGVTPNASYGYTVRARLGSAESEASNRLSLLTPANASQTDTAAASVPLNLAATSVSSNSVSLTWSASTKTGGDATLAGYEILRGDGSGSNFVKIATVKLPGYIDASVSASSSYSYLVRSFTSAGVYSQFGAGWAVTTPAAVDLSDTTPPSVPANVTADGTSGVVALSWSASTKSSGDRLVAGYLVYRNGVQVADVKMGTVYLDSAVAAGTAYSYSVKAYDNPGNLSQGSSAVSVTTPAAPAGTYTVSGRITLNGSALSGVMVTIAGGGESANLVTDANGNYTFTGAKNGSYTITPAATGYYLFTPSVRNVSVSDAKVSGQDFQSKLAGSVTAGTSYPAGTIIGGISYPTGAVVGGVYYPTATVIGGVTYPTGSVIGGIAYPTGVVIGGVSYPAGTIVGGIAFPVGAVTTGFSYPSGTVIGGVIYPTGSVVGSASYPTGVVVGGIIYPAGTIVTGTLYPTGSVSGGTGYPSGSVTGSTGYPTGSVSGGTGYPTGGLLGGTFFPTSSVNGTLSYPSGVVVGGVIYPTGLVTGGTIYPTGGVIGQVTYPSGAVTGAMAYPSGSVTGALGW